MSECSAGSNCKAFDCPEHALTGKAPPGLYGVYAEPAVGQMNPPTWHTSQPTDYESAAQIADSMNRCNHAWFYYAKPLMVKKLT